MVELLIGALDGPARGVGEIGAEGCRRVAGGALLLDRRARRAL
jgi:hypothetical protein